VRRELLKRMLRQEKPCYATGIYPEQERAMTDEQIAEFDRRARALIYWLRDNGQPHMTILIDSERAELVEGLRSCNEWSSCAERRQEDKGHE
jgi:hypothetical protein